MTEDELRYYQRQIILPEIGLDGQSNLKKGSVLVIGAGGLGCPVLEFMARAGVGKIGIVDGDIVDVSNLHRQILYTFKDIGLPKAEVAKNKLNDINPFINVVAFSENLNPENALNLFQQFDIIVDATDNYPTRYLINDACVIKNKPLVYGSIYRFEGQVSVFNYLGSATYRCLFPQYPEQLSNTNCATAGVIGVLPGLIGTMQANEVIKILLKDKNVLNDKLVTYNSKTNKTHSISLKRNTIFDYSKIQVGNKLEHPFYSLLCVQEIEINNDELLQFKNQGEKIIFIDVREPEEQPQFHHKNVYSIPLKNINNHFDFPDSQMTVIICKSGIRSKEAQRILSSKMPAKKIVSLKGGISNQIIELWNKKQ